MEIAIHGDFYRLESPYEANHISVNAVSKDKKQAIALLFNLLQESNLSRYFKVKGLDNNKKYKNSYNWEIQKGDFYAKVGVNLVRWIENFQAILITFDEV